MSAAFVTSTLIEVALVCLFIFGLLHEKQLIAWEDRAVEWICRRIAYSKRRKRIARQRAALYTGQHGQPGRKNPNRAA